MTTSALSSALLSRWTMGCFALVAACATPGAQPHDMSAAGHQNEAQHHAAMAQEHAAKYDPNRTGARSGACVGPRTRWGDYPYDLCWSSVTNPTERHLQEAEDHQRHAADHRAASAALRDAEAQKCAGIAPGDRDMSPFEHREDIARVEPLKLNSSPRSAPTLTGAVITFRAIPGMSAEWLQRAVDCHLARNAALGHEVPEMPDCPLVPKGVEARVTSTGDGFAVELRADDPKTAAEVLRRAERLIAGTPVSSR